MLCFTNFLAFDPQKKLLTLSIQYLNRPPISDICLNHKSNTDVSFAWTYLPFDFIFTLIFYSSAVIQYLLPHLKTYQHYKYLIQERGYKERKCSYACKSARIQPPCLWMNMPVCISSLDSVSLAKKSNSLVPPFLVNHSQNLRQEYIQQEKLIKCC